MQYHIQTGPIIDSFKNDCGCPLCQLQKITEERFVSQYLNEGVMEPDYRVRVNKTGFCKKHLTDMYKGENKLGLSLQLNTRTEYILSNLKIADSPGIAKKQAETIRKGEKNCVICEEVSEIMKRYAMTVAQMFKYERDFPRTLEDSSGFCLEHYALLLEHSANAGNQSKRYTATLSKVEITAIKIDNENIERFTNRFDYNSKDKFSGNTDKATKNLINRLKGDIVE